ncbi:MAG: hypothetical protein KIS66_13760 [Fimbriimonadaceae bacterium]|nr:hypothetical protein [Fimbriimonadaceae bacterium]
MRKPKTKKLVPLGEPLPEPTDQDAEYTEADIEAAKRSWRENCPDGFESLLDAE